MARKEMTMSEHAVDLMLAQQEIADRGANALIDHVMALTLLEAVPYEHREAAPTVVIDPADIVSMVQTYRIERILNEDGSRGVRLHRRSEEKT